MIVAGSSSDDDSDTTSYPGDPLDAIKSGRERDFASPRGRGPMAIAPEFIDACERALGISLVSFDEYY